MKVGLWPSRRGRHIYCGKCGYQLLLEQKDCPECGVSVVVHPPKVGRRIRKPLLAIIGVMLLVVFASGVGLWIYGQAVNINWYQQAPIWWVAWDLNSSHASSREKAYRELSRRHQGNLLTTEDVSLIIDTALVHMDQFAHTHATQHSATNQLLFWLTEQWNQGNFNLEQEKRAAELIKKHVGPQTFSPVEWHLSRWGARLAKQDRIDDDQANIDDFFDVLEQFQSHVNKNQKWILVNVARYLRARAEYGGLTKGQLERFRKVAKQHLHTYKPFGGFWFSITMAEFLQLEYQAGRLSKEEWQKVCSMFFHVELNVQKQSAQERKTFILDFKLRTPFYVDQWWAAIKRYDVFVNGQSISLLAYQQPSDGSTVNVITGSGGIDRRIKVSMEYAREGQNEIQVKIQWKLYDGPKGDERNSQFLGNFVTIVSENFDVFDQKESIKK